MTPVPEANLLAPWVVEEAYESFDLTGNPFDSWRTTATFIHYDDALYFAKRATRSRKLRVGSVHVAFEEARP